MQYISNTSQDKEEMLKTIGISSFEDLIRNVPRGLQNFKLKIPEGISEIELQKKFYELGKQNKNMQDYASYLGGGNYDHFVPYVVRHLVERGEFITSYTPYQGEASQGTLQTIYEYQSLICELTGMDVSNASHYDGATATAEGVMAAINHTGRNKALFARSVHPDYRDVTKTYLRGRDHEVEEVSCDGEGKVDRGDFAAKLTQEVAVVVVQTPNFFGLLENISDIAQVAHANGSLLMVVANPLSLGVCKAPGEWGADLSAGEGQPLGLPQFFGGPYLGYLTVKKPLMRKIPGRLCGITKDTEGVRSFVLTLQAREQHIRREKASSNICTNQALCALMATIYMTSLGKVGIQEVGVANMAKSNQLRKELSSVKGVEIITKGPIFNEFLVRIKSRDSFVKKMEENGYFAGVPVDRWYPEETEGLLICATEKRTDEEIKQFVSSVKAVLK